MLVTTVIAATAPLPATPALLIVHGLFGSARNWGVIARHFAISRDVVSVDMRNHGQSPWSDHHRYIDMAEDLAEVITAHGAPMDVLGHSMGGPITQRALLVLGDKIQAASIWSGSGFGPSRNIDEPYLPTSLVRWILSSASKPLTRD